MAQTPPIPAGIGRMIAPVGSPAPLTPTMTPAIPDMDSMPVSRGAPTPPIPANVGQSVAGSASSFSGAAADAASPPTLLRDVGAGAVKGVENLVNTGAALANTVLNPQGDTSHTEAHERFGLPARQVQPGVDLNGALKAITPPAVQNLDRWANATHPHGLLGAAAQGVGEMAPFAVGALMPGADELSAIARLRSLAGLATMGATSGVGGKLGEGIGRNVAGQEGAEVGGVLGSLMGGVAPALTGYGAVKTAQGLLDAVPMTDAAKARWAAGNIQNFEPDLASARQRVEQAATPLRVGSETVPRGSNGEILPGATPTAIQLAGSQGLARLGEGLKSAGQGEPLVAAEHGQQVAAARAVHGLAPGAGASPSSVAAYLKQLLEAEDTKAGATETGAIDARAAAIEQQPGMTGIVTPYQAGKAAQDLMADKAAEQAREVNNRYQKLYDANPVINMAPLGETARGIAKEVVGNKGELAPGEGQLLQRALDLGKSPETNWRQVNQFRVDLNEALNNSRDSFGQATPLTHRLGLLKGGLKDALAKATTDALAEPEAVAETTEPENLAEAGLSAQNSDHAGHSEPDSSNLGQGHPVGTGASDEREPLSGERLGIVPSLGDAAPVPGGSDLGLPPQRDVDGLHRGAGLAGVPVSLPEAASLGGRGSGEGVGSDVPGGVSEAASGTDTGPNGAVLGPPFNAEHAQQNLEALAAHGARKELFANKQIGPILKKLPNGNLAMAPEEVVKQLVAPGPKGAQMASAITAVARFDPSLAEHFHTAIGLDIRRAAMNPDGSINLSDLNNWRKMHAPLLNAQPQVAARVSSIEGAQQMVEDAVAKRAAIQQSFKTKAIQSFLNGEDPSVGMARVLAGTPVDARAFLRRLQPDAPAVAGAQQAMGENLARKLLSPVAGAENGEERVQVGSVRALLGDPAKLQIIREFLGPQAPQRLRQIAQHFDAYNARAMSGVNAAGSATTPLRQIANQLAEPKTLLGRVVASWTNPVAIAASALPTGIGGEIGAQAAGALFRGWRGKHLAAATDLIAKALADPKVFLEVTRPIPKSAPAATALMKRARQAIINSYVNAPGS